MQRSHFALKLVPPRATFFADQTEREAAIMADHVAYWTGLLARGSVVAFGPVLDPAGVWGLAVVEADSEAEVRGMIAADPAVTSGLGTMQLMSMPSAVVRGAGTA